jgi:hypothetical protein
MILYSHASIHEQKHRINVSDHWPGMSDMKSIASEKRKDSEHNCQVSASALIPSFCFIMISSRSTIEHF